jgi:hypothetical protein
MTQIRSTRTSTSILNTDLYRRRRRRHGHGHRLGHQQPLSVLVVRLGWLRQALLVLPVSVLQVILVLVLVLIVRLPVVQASAVRNFC